MLIFLHERANFFKIAIFVLFLSVEHSELSSLTKVPQGKVQLKKFPPKKKKTYIFVMDLFFTIRTFGNNIRLGHLMCFTLSWTFFFQKIQFSRHLKFFFVGQIRLSVKKRLLLNDNLGGCKHLTWNF
jgi:hypothetical protein